MTDQLDVLALVASRLDQAGIPYMVTGSMASGYYGQPRMTRDVDLVVELGSGHPESLPALLGEDFLLSSETVRAAMTHRTMFNAIHRYAFVKVDFVIRKGSAYRVEEFARRRRVDLDGHPVWMVSVEDLILSKVLWSRDSRSEVQLRDVRGIIALQASAIDWIYIERWARTLDIADQLRELHR